MRTAFFVLFLFPISFLTAQEDHGLTPSDIQRGGEMYLTNCASCHGPDGDRVSGVDLGSNHFRRAQTDNELYEIIRKGIPGTPMPPGAYAENQLRLLVGYLHSMGSMPRTVNTGDAQRGKAIFEGKGKCLGCHRIGSRGGFAAPDLGQIGMKRRAADLERSLLDPNAEIRAENRTIRAVRTDGTRASGVLLNQDTYSIQLRDSAGKLMSLPKDKLEKFEILTTSPMPSYKGTLTAEETADTVAYLMTLKDGGR